MAKIQKPDLAQIEAYRGKALTPAGKRRWQVLALLAQDSSIMEVASASGYSSRWVRELARRYQKLGMAVLNDLRKQNAGPATLLSQTEQAELRLLLQNPPPTGRKWTGQKVADWIATKKGRKVARQRGWEYLQRLRS